MTTTTPRKSRSSAPIVGFKALTEEGPGVYSGIVSVFGNVDHHGDRIHPGAFAASLERWKSSGDPIPVIFSHQWDNLDAHVGVVLEAEELLPGSGDVRLAGTGLEDHGGLWTKFALDVEEDFAGRLAKRLDRKSIREFSFAYDVLDEQRDPDGANGLLELDVIEVGPTLKGANGLTRLLSANLDDPAEVTAAGELLVDETLETLRDLGAGDLADELVKARTAAAGEKAFVPIDFDGSVEAKLDQVRSSAEAWALELDLGDGGFYALHLEATYLEEGKAIVLVEGWNDPVGMGVFYEVDVVADDETGELSIENPREVEVSVTVGAKAARRHQDADRGEKARRRGSALAGDEGATVRADGKSSSPGEPSSTGPGGSSAARTRLELDLLELG